MAYKEVTVIKSPVTTRYVMPGAQAQIDEETNRIRAGGVWFDFNLEHWKVVTEKEKEASFVNAALKDKLTDHEFTLLIKAYAITEETAMRWIIGTGNFIEHNLNGG